MLDRRFLPAVLLLFLFTCGKVPTPAPAQRTNLRVLDINVWSGLDYVGNLWMGEYEPVTLRQRRREILINQIRELGPDVIGIHEANKLPGYAEDLAAELGYAQVNHTGVGGVRAGPIGLPWNLREGDALLMKADMALHNFHREQLSGGHVGSFFTFHFDDATQILCADAVVNKRGLAVCTVHWHASPLDTPEVRAKLEKLRDQWRASPGDYEAALHNITAGAAWRMEEAKKTIAFIERSSDRPVILIGDFNATVETEEIKALTSAGFEDTFALANKDRNDFTWNPLENLNQKKYYIEQAKKPESIAEDLDQWYDRIPRRIDHILLKRHASLPMRVKSSRVVINTAVGGVHASDHFGIFTEFEFGP